MRNFLKKNGSVLTDLFVYFLMALIGVLTMAFPVIGFENPILYSSMLFFILGFFSFAGYFYEKDSRKTYELLMFSMISIFSGVYLFVFEIKSVPFALGTGYLIFSLLNAINKSYYSYKLKKYDNEFWLLKAISVILLLFVSVLAIQNFYRMFSEVQSVIIGYYFLCYGIISFLEVLIIYRLKPETFKEIVEGNVPRSKKLKKITDIDSDVDKLNKIIKKKKSKRKSRK